MHILFLVKNHVEKIHKLDQMSILGQINVIAIKRFFTSLKVNDLSNNLSPMHSKQGMHRHL
jgi:hypothetical protein